MKPEEARKILGLGSLALDRQRLQRAFHRRLFEIHPDTRHTLADLTSADFQSAEHRDPPGIEGLRDPFAETGPEKANHRQHGDVAPDSGDVSVDMLIEARKVLLLSLERSPSHPEDSGSFHGRSPHDVSAADAAPSGPESTQDRETERSRDPRFAATAGAGADGYNYYRKALFLYSEAILEYFERRKGFHGKTVSEPEAEPRGFRERLEEARSLFVQVLELFPGGTWTPDSIEQIARINVWLKRYRAGGSQVPK
ncbi:MAG: hypothetical protein KDK25_03975 [Leptospiraceae bacterium]|nr:hypothetical protein [Leptospiraceae bacterium]